MGVVVVVVVGLGVGGTLREMAPEIPLVLEAPRRGAATAGRQAIWRTGIPI